MKFQLLIIILLNMVVSSAACQKMTNISGYIPEARDSSLSVQLYINDPTVLNTSKQKLLDSHTKNGCFSFKFNLDTPSMIVLLINGENIFYPGKFHVLIEPHDSINFQIQDIKRLGLMNIQATGNGSEKIEFLKSFFPAIQSINKRFPSYQNQPIQRTFETVDQKLNIIDSAYTCFKRNLNLHAKDILRAYEYHYTMDIPFITATRSESDSLRYFFDKYIIQKKRMDILARPQVINYYPHHVLSNYVLLSAFKQPYKEIDLNFIKSHSNEYAKLIVKYFKDNIPIKDYMLAHLTLSKLKTEMLNDDVKMLYKFYISNVSFKSMFYKEVQDQYNYNSANLANGTPFFNFTLPDSTGWHHKLSDFKGKVVVLDFWFYGCTGCAQVTKALDSLERRFSSDKVEFISVNIDTKKTWLAGIGKYSSRNSLNLYTNEKGADHPLIKYLNFSTYPRLVVVDQYGNMVGTPPDPRTNREEFVKFINSL